MLAISFKVNATTCYVDDKVRIIFTKENCEMKLAKKAYGIDTDGVKYFGCWATNPNNGSIYVLWKTIEKEFLIYPKNLLSTCI